MVAIDREDGGSGGLFDVSISIYRPCWEAMFYRRGTSNVDQIRVVFVERADEQKGILRM